MRRLVRGVVTALAVLLLAAVAGCSSPFPSAESPAGQGPPAPATSTTIPAGPPTLSVARLGLRTVPLVALGLARDRTVMVPPVEQPQTVGWYRLGPRPGADGPAVILGHINGGGQPGAFARLADMQVGDEIVTGDAGRTSTFRVTRVDRVPKERFPTRAVYSDTPGPELRLISCGGSFNGEDYRDNVIVWAAAHQQ